MNGTRLLGLGFAVLRATESLKEYSPLIPPPQVKSTFTVLLGGALSLLTGERDPVKIVIEGVAIAGVASLLHDAQDSMKRFTDNQIAGVIQHVPRRAGPLGANG